MAELAKDMRGRARCRGGRRGLQSASDRDAGFGLKKRMWVLAFERPVSTYRCLPGPTLPRHLPQSQVTVTRGGRWEENRQKLLNVKMSRGSERTRHLGKASARRHTKCSVLQVLREEIPGRRKYLI